MEKSPQSNVMGTVYLLHLESPMGFNRHYAGFASQLENRLFHHRNGTGSRFLAEANRRGIPYSIAADYPATRLLERATKNTKSLAQSCPVCNPKTARSPLTYPFRCNIPKKTLAEWASIRMLALIRSDGYAKARESMVDQIQGYLNDINEQYGAGGIVDTVPDYPEHPETVYYGRPTAEQVLARGIVGRPMTKEEVVAIYGHPDITIETIDELLNLTK